MVFYRGEFLPNKHQALGGRRGVRLTMHLGPRLNAKTDQRQNKRDREFMPAAENREREPWTQLSEYIEALVVQGQSTAREEAVKQYRVLCGIFGKKKIRAETLEAKKRLGLDEVRS